MCNLVTDTEGSFPDDPAAESDHPPPSDGKGYEESAQLCVEKKTKAYSRLLYLFLPPDSKTVSILKTEFHFVK
jgi:hypothetical protein